MTFWLLHTITYLSILTIWKSDKSIFWLIESDNSSQSQMTYESLTVVSDMVVVQSPQFTAKRFQTNFFVDFKGTINFLKGFLVIVLHIFLDFIVIWNLRMLHSGDVKVPCCFFRWEFSVVKNHFEGWRFSDFRAKFRHYSWDLSGNWVKTLLSWARNFNKINHMQPGESIFSETQWALYLCRMCRKNQIWCLL